LATDFANKYRSDVFYRTGWNVVLLQLTFTVILLTLIGVIFSFLYRDILQSFLTSLTQIITMPDPTAEGPTLIADLEYLKTRSLVFAGTGVLIAAAVFGYLITRLALVPVHQALDQQKQFIGNVAHELRTPLSVIKTNTEVLLLKNNLNRDVAEVLASNVEEIDRISNITNNLLSLTSLLRPEQIEFSNVDMGDIADRTAKILDTFAARKNIDVTVQKSKYITAWGNNAALEQICINILKNAIHHTPRGGKITVSVGPVARDYVGLLIEDTGAGISEKDLKRIFEPFYRVDPSRTRDTGSSGLGLAIVNELVKLHRGSIEIQSSLTRGTAVSILIPSGKKTHNKQAASRLEEVPVT
jgi:signal transduction histidine kinase